jgi:ech hydrogenase subunit A
VSQRNAKLVLAYSTIANLGLVVACGGIDSYTAIWSAIMLIIFHAVSKSLLFLSVGAVQNRLATKDIEHMDYLISRMPVLAAVMVIGIAGMFLAPFGMLISKWITLKAFIDFNPILAVMLAYGSAATLFFWSKWLGKILTIRDGLADMESGISSGMWTALVTLALSTIVVCVLFPIISSFVIEPYILHIYEETFSMAYRDMLIIMILMISLLVILPAGILYHAYINKKFKPAAVYLGGRNISGTTYMDAMGNERSPELKNYYLENIFGERRLSIAGVIASVILISIMFGVVII